jgi:hypothetical protein
MVIANEETPEAFPILRVYRKEGEVFILSTFFDGSLLCYPILACSQEAGMM